MLQPTGSSARALKQLQQRVLVAPGSFHSSDKPNCIVPVLAISVSLTGLIVKERSDRQPAAARQVGRLEGRLAAATKKLLGPG